MSRETDTAAEQRHADRRAEDVRIWEAIDSIGKALERLEAHAEHNGGLLQEVRSDMKHLTANGCALAPQHSDFKARLDALEGRAGTLTGAAGIGSVAGAVLTGIGQWIWTHLNKG